MRKKHTFIIDDRLPTNLIMKNIIYILLLLLGLSCNSNNKISFDENDVKSLINSDSTPINYDGIWAMTNYFDTIVAHKELAKYRLQDPTSIAIILEIEKDSMNIYGSISNNKLSIEKEKDTLTTIISEMSGDKWWLIKNKGQFELIQHPNQEYIDSTVYIYKKQSAFNYFTKENTDFYVIGKNVTDYFNKMIFEGKYVISGTESHVTFGQNGILKGFDSFDTYEVRNYFGTLHMHKNLDVITFGNKTNNDFKEYNWVFKDDQLILTEFIYEKVSYKGKIYDGDYLILGEEKIVLRKL